MNQVTCGTCGEAVTPEVPLGITDEEWTARHWHPNALEDFVTAEDNRGRELHGRQFVTSGAALVLEPLSLADWRRTCQSIRRSLKAKTRRDWTSRELENEYPLLVTAKDTLSRKDYRRLVRYIRGVL